jgi:hypothetical protein
MWTAPCKTFADRFGDLVGCSLMSSPFVRRIWPLALMEVADRVPYQDCALSQPQLGASMRKAMAQAETRTCGESEVSSQAAGVPTQSNGPLTL